MIEINGVDATQTPPAKRGLAMVFQSYALYPHMSVRKNIAFPLKMAKLAPQDRDAKVEAAAAVLNLTDYLDRRPGQLSGGQRQRVAIGRAIVREPDAFLFDEPLSNLDAALRVNMRLEISELHQTLKTTMIYVTHDQVEAMTMADKIVVLQAGHIEQVGSPLETLPQAGQSICRRIHRFTQDELCHRCPCATNGCGNNWLSAGTYCDFAVRRNIQWHCRCFRTSGIRHVLAGQCRRHGQHHRACGW